MYILLSIPNLTQNLYLRVRIWHHRNNMQHRDTTRQYRQHCLFDWYFISKKCTYICINSTYKQIKSSMSIQSHVYRSTWNNTCKYIITTVIHFFCIYVSLFILINYSTTVKCRYNAVQYCEILHKWLPELRQNISQMLDLRKTSHT